MNKKCLNKCLGLPQTFLVNPGPGTQGPYTATQLGHPGMPQEVLSGKGQSVAVLDLPANMTVCMHALLQSTKYQEMCDYSKVKECSACKRR